MFYGGGEGWFHKRVKKKFFSYLYPTKLIVSTQSNNRPCAKNIANLANSTVGLKNMVYNDENYLERQKLLSVDQTEKTLM